ncbi:MAG: winged helix-turn-helix transcriptional regulator [Planctomycetes bacterium]|nr:winged helix-turn-helix transcriptional regulator [Planctomycetota bacterium]
MTCFFRALGNHRRRTVLELILEAAQEKPARSGVRSFITVSEIARRLRLSQPAVSQYVDKLVTAKLVEIKRLGAAHLCMPNLESIARLRDYFQGLLKA